MNTPMEYTDWLYWVLTRPLRLWSFSSYVPKVLSFVAYTVMLLARIVFSLLWFVLSMVFTVVLIIFEPLALFIRIIEYNIHVVIDFWLSQLFDTSLAQLFDYQFGVSQLRVVFQWLRYVNLMCITAMVLGIVSYYTLVRVIYWLTKMEKKKVQPKVVKAVPVFKQPSQTTHEETAQPQETYPTPMTTSYEPEIPPYTFQRLFDDDEDDSFTLTSMTPNTTTPTTVRASNNIHTGTQDMIHEPQEKQESPITKAFRSRVSSSNTQASTIRTSTTNGTHNGDYDTLGSTTSSVFSRGVITPISTIDEEDEEFDA